ncbi:MAG: hypothetical protein AAGD14_17355, partial [Planctomycetota bacterium]
MQAALLTILLFANTGAQRYHEAYILEVVEGKVAEAAKIYAELMTDARGTAGIRQQAEFRFAICCALLGRPDEARARLARLSNEKWLLESLRPQIVEYRKALDGVGTGTALQARMEELTLELAKVSEHAVNPPIYRTFEVIGKPAIPHLKKLLDHSDEGIRTHAVHLLARLDVPDLISLFDPSRVAPVQGVARYFRRHPDQIPELERKLRAIESPSRAAGYAQRFGSFVPFSFEFGEWLMESEVSTSWGLTHLMRETDPARIDARLRRWIAKGRPAQRKAAVEFYARWKRHQSSVPWDASFFPAYIDAVIAHATVPSDMDSFARAVPSAARLDALEKVLLACKGDRLGESALGSNNLADLLARSVEEEGCDLARYRSILDGWNQLVLHKYGWPWVLLPH